MCTFNPFYRMFKKWASKPVFGVSNKARIKPVSPVKETSKKIEILLVASSDIKLSKLVDLMVLKRSPDLLNNVKIGQDQLRLIMKHILFYMECSNFGQVN